MFRRVYGDSFCAPRTLYGASQVALVAKNLPANAGDIRDAGSIPGLGRSPEEGNSIGHTDSMDCE